MRLPDAAPHVAFVHSAFDHGLLTLNHRLPVRMSHRSRGVESVRHRSRSAFLGNLTATLPTLLVHLEGSNAAGFRDAVCATPTAVAIFMSFGVLWLTVWLLRMLAKS